MLQPYPTVIEFGADAAAEAQIAALQAVVLGVRQIRGELDVPHSRATPVYVRVAKPGDAEALAALSATIARVANLESLTIVQSEARFAAVRHRNHRRPHDPRAVCTTRR